MEFRAEVNRQETRVMGLSSSSTTTTTSYSMNQSINQSG